MRRPSWRGAMFALAAICLLAVGAALVAQHGFDMQPCPWCILQRLIFLVIALVAIAGAWVPRRGSRRGVVLLVLVLALCGVASAVWQHVVAAQQFSCNLTLADRVITVLRLETLLPPLFQVTASCADAAVTVLGVPFEYWSLLLFALIGVAAFALALRPAPR